MTLSDLQKDLIGYLSTRTGVEDIQLVQDEPGNYIYGFLCEGVAVSMSLSYTQ